MKIYFVLLFLFNLIIYVFPQDFNCNNSVKIISPKSYIDEFYSKKLRLLEDYSSFFIEIFLQLLEPDIDIKKMLLDNKELILEFLKEGLGDESYSSNIYDIFDNFLNKSNDYFSEIVGEIENNREDIKKKVMKMESGNFMKLLIILLEYETIANNFGLFIYENPDLLQMLYLYGKNYNITDISENEKEELLTNLINFLTYYRDIFKMAGDIFNPNNKNIYIIIANYALNKDNFTIDFLRLFKDNKKMPLLLKELIDNPEIKGIFDYIYKYSEDIEFFIISQRKMKK